MNTLQYDLSQLNANFDDLLFNIGLSKKDVYELCNIKGTGKFTSLCFLEVQKILEKLNFDLRELGKNNICHQTLRKQLDGNSLAVKEEFIGNKGSRVKTIESAQSLLTKESRNRILRKHQIHENVLADGSRLVSAELLKSVFKDGFHMPDNIVFATNTHDHVSELTLILVFCLFTLTYSPRSQSF